MRRTRSPGAGNARELKVMAVLAEEGWLCASRRHIGGAGDILAIQLSNPPWISDGVNALLIEVKSTARSPWHGFPPSDREAMVETAHLVGAIPYLYWWPPRGRLQRIPASDWPISKLKTQVEVETRKAPHE